jgi:hypothetical protein
MAARTLGQLRTAVEDYGLGVDLSSQQNGWINAEYRNIAGMRRWRWLQARFTFPTVIGQAAYTPSATDIRNLDKLRLADANGIEYDMDAAPDKWVQDQVHRYNQLYDRAAPQFWGAYAGQIYLYPIPDLVYTAQVDYTRNVVPMVADGDTHLMPEEYDDAIVYGVLSRSFVRQNNWLMRDWALSQQQGVLNSMKDSDSENQTQRSGEIETTGIWGHGVDLWRP